MILCIRSDKDVTYCALWHYDAEISNVEWNAGRELSIQLLNKVEKLLDDKNKNLKDLEGIIIYGGPGSYTGLRISFSFANALAFANNIPLIAKSGDSWIKDGIVELGRTKKYKPVAPNYGGEVYTTKPKK